MRVCSPKDFYDKTTPHTFGLDDSLVKMDTSTLNDLKASEEHNKPHAQPLKFQKPKTLMTKQQLEMNYYP